MIKLIFINILRYFITQIRDILFAARRLIILFITVKKYLIKIDFESCIILELINK